MSCVHTRRLRSQVRRGPAGSGPSREPRPAPTPAPPPTPSHVDSLPMQPETEPRLCLHGDLWNSNPTVEPGSMDAAAQHPAKRILKTNIPCKQDISFCQRDQKKS